MQNEEEMFGLMLSLIAVLFMCVLCLAGNLPENFGMSEGIFFIMLPVAIVGFIIVLLVMRSD